MSDAAGLDLETIFSAALAKRSPEVRAAYLEQACAGDKDLRRNAECLLNAYPGVGSFLEQPAAELLGALRFGQHEIETVKECEERLLSEFLSPCDKPDRIGTLGPYEILEVVGRGGMGIVLRAHDVKLNRIVAIKVMAPELAANPTAVRRFLREAQSAAAVSHDHVVTIYAVDDSKRLPFLVMEFVQGQSLQARIDQHGPLELKEILRIGMQVASGLAAAHKQGVIHRDVKPANILLENGVERVKITDFGLARAADEACLTQTGMVSGTPQYMSPEQARGEGVDCRTDLFSLGSVLYAMCTGHAPFRAEHAVAVLRRVSDDAPRPIRDVNPDIPDWLAQVVDKLQAKNPANRFQSAGEVADLLAQYLARSQHPSVVATPASPSPQSSDQPSELAEQQAPRRNLPGRRLVTAAALLLLAGSLGLTEATGVTGVVQYLGAVLRISTPEGVLVVEVDDPQVQVTIEGDGGIKITGAGPQEVRLQPGQYQVRATKEGKSLSEELITITRGDKQVVRVSREGISPRVEQPTVKTEPQAFVLLGGKGVAVRKFDTLAEAVLAASDGDTIEIRGNGPFVTEPVKTSNALTVRAADGFRPVIQLSPEALQARAHLLETNAALILEGLELQLVAAVPEKRGYRLPWQAIVFASKGPLHIANCRFLFKRSWGGAIGTGATISEMRNTEILRLGGSVFGVNWWHGGPGQLLVIDNCCLPEVGVDYGTQAKTDFRVENSVRLTRNTFVGDAHALVLHGQEKVPDLSIKDRQTKLVRVEASGNIWDTSSSVMLLSQTAPGNILPPGEAEAALPRILAWQGERNLYVVKDRFLGLGFNDGAPQGLVPVDPIRSLAAWRRFWGADEAGSIEGRVRYQGGDLHSRLVIAPEKLTPEDFRLRPDSAGYRAGPDGKDLGADIDLVGPGEAYRRWKKTPEYQQWLEATGQLK